MARENEPVIVKVAGREYELVVARKRLGGEQLFRVDHQNQVILLSKGVEGRHAVEAFVAAHQAAMLYVIKRDDVSAEARAQLLASTERMLYDTHADGPLVEMLKRAGVGGFEEPAEPWLTPRRGVLVGCLATAVVAATVFYWGKLAGWIATPTPVSPRVLEPVSGFQDLESHMQRIETALSPGLLKPVIDPRGPWVYHSKSAHGIVRSSVTGEGPVSVVFEGEQPLNQMAISPDGSALVVMELGGRISVVSLKNRSFPVSVLEVPSATQVVLANASTLLWADSSDTWHKTAARGGEESEVLRGVSGVVVASSRDGLVAMVSGKNGSRFMEIRDLISGTSHGTLTINSEQKPVAIDATPDLRMIVVGLNDGTLVRFQRALTGASVETATIPVHGGGLRIRCDTKGQVFLAAGDELRMIEYGGMTNTARITEDRMPLGAAVGLRWSQWPYAFSLLRRQGVTTWRP